jgi:hypothetical protein
MPPWIGRRNLKEIEMHWQNDKEVEFSSLIGKTLVRADATEACIEFEDTDGDIYRMDHEQDCCESVSIESIVGDLADLIGAPILKAEEASNSDQGPDDSYTWTFYKIATIKGYVDIRWYGTSNGYYSESVDFYHVNGSVDRSALGREG